MFSDNKATGTSTMMLDSTQEESPSKQQDGSKSKFNFELDDYKESGFAVGARFIREIWYYAYASRKLKPGSIITKKFLGEQILIGRDNQGRLFAMKDACPHQGYPLSANKYDGCAVECAFHGWKFGNDGVCNEIPSLLPDQSFNLCSVRSKTYPIQESQGNIWIYIGEKRENLPPIPQALGLGEAGFDKTECNLWLPNHIDYNVAALIDIAHVPYVHKSWWWRSKKKMYEKQKNYVPEANGWTIVKHSPSKNAFIFQLLGGVLETEIAFRLPGIRLEQIIYKGKPILSGMTCLTPIDEHNTELNHTTYWTVPFVATFIRPIVDYFVKEFLSQDQTVAIKQQPILKEKPNLIMTIKDAGTPGRWYFLLKKEWIEASEQGRPFVNPIKPSLLRWRS